MERRFQPLQMLLLFFGGWVNRHQQHIIEYLLEENRILKDLQKGRRLRLNDDQRGRLAVKGKILGRKLLQQFATLVTPETILAWHRKLIALKWTYQRKGPGRPHVMKEITAHVIRMAKENPSWGYDRIQGALSNIGHTVAPTTIGNILKKHGIDPAPLRRKRTNWKTFLKSHWEVLVAADFFTIEVWTLGGLVTFYVLFLIEISARKVRIAGITHTPDEVFMRQIARNITYPEDGFLNGKRFLIIDRDKKYCQGFLEILKDSGTKPVRCPPKAPNCNAIAERFVRSIKEECLNKLVFFGLASLRRAVSQYAIHYHEERNHQGIGNCLIEPREKHGSLEGQLYRKKRLGGLLNFYYRRAA